MDKFQSAYDILNKATTRQLRNLEELRNDIREKRKVASQQQLGTEMTGGFLEGDIQALEREYLEASNDIVADANTRRQIIDEARKAAIQAETQRKVDERMGEMRDLGSASLAAVSPFIPGGAGGLVSGLGGAIGGMFSRKPKPQTPIGRDVDPLYMTEPDDQYSEDWWRR